MNLGLAFCESSVESPTNSTAPVLAPKHRAPTTDNEVVDASPDLGGLELAVDENAGAQLVGAAPEDAQAAEIGFRVTRDGRITYVKMSQLDQVDRECLLDLGVSYLGATRANLDEMLDVDIRHELRAIVQGEDELAFRQTASRHEAIEHRAAQLLEDGAAGVQKMKDKLWRLNEDCLLYTSPSPRDRTRSRMPSSA
eukprot:TRINITY_DN22762_c0_g1_i1.p1 TRINITY_DN22762_c0_g1~~TRINITY_DN22762_c0_g1_i1.p1  ORF type:complete len:196 (-),score=46.71 TRINITY_DN22762_c0_g1_i1:49-636(-)